MAFDQQTIIMAKAFAEGYELGMEYAKTILKGDTINDKQKRK